MPSGATCACMIILNIPRRSCVLALVSKHLMHVWAKIERWVPSLISTTGATPVEGQSVAAFRTCITGEGERATIYWLVTGGPGGCDQRTAANGCARLQAGTALHSQVLWRKVVCANCVVGGSSESCPITSTALDTLGFMHAPPSLQPFLPRHRPTR